MPVYLMPCTLDLCAKQVANRGLSSTDLWSVVSSGDHSLVGTLRFCRDCGWQFFPPCVFVCVSVWLWLSFWCVCGHTRVTICEFAMCILSLTFSRAFPFGVCARAYGEESCEVLVSIQEFIFSLELDLKKKKRTGQKN